MYATTQILFAKCDIAQYFANNRSLIRNVRVIRRI